MRPAPSPTASSIDWRVSPEQYNTTFELHSNEALSLSRGDYDLVQIHHFPIYGPTTRSEIKSLEGKRVLFTCKGDPILIANIHQVEAPEKDGDGWTLEAFAEGDGEYVVITPHNRGSHQHRLNPPTFWNALERALAERWELDNDYTQAAVRCLNDGRGILQGLMSGTEFGDKRVTERERKIAATAIQWLGTNCGRCWLEEVLRAAGFKLIEPTAPSSAYREEVK